MKKLFTLTFLMLLCCAMTFAQNEVEFVTKQGTVIPSGSVFEAQGEFMDFDGEYEKDSGIYLKNNTGSDVKVKLFVKIKNHLDGMGYGVCPANDCAYLDLENQPSVEKVFMVGTRRYERIKTHFSYKDGVSGSCSLEVTVSVNGKECSKIELTYTTHDVSGIDSITTDNALCNVYDITGKLVKAGVNRNDVNTMNSGLYIIRELTGANKVNKVIVK